MRKINNRPEIIRGHMQFSGISKTFDIKRTVNTLGRGADDTFSKTTCSGAVDIFAKTTCSGAAKTNDETGTFMYNNIKLANSKWNTFSTQWCKEKKFEILSLGAPAVFEDMALLKTKKYFAKPTNVFRKTQPIDQTPVSFDSLFKRPGIYMIFNRINKRYYIGMTSNLKCRFYNYLDTNRLKENGTSRISRALLKYGYKNFSISILEFGDELQKKDETGKFTWILREREKFFIEVFNPQYNIRRHYYTVKKKWKNIEGEFQDSRAIPIKAMDLLKKCLDPKMKGWALYAFNSNVGKEYHYFKAITPKSVITVNTNGWLDGEIIRKSGWVELKHKVTEYECSWFAFALVDRQDLREFLAGSPNWTEEKPGTLVSKKVRAIKLHLAKLDAKIPKPVRDIVKDDKK